MQGKKLRERGLRKCTKVTAAGHAFLFMNVMNKRRLQQVHARLFRNDTSSVLERCLALVAAGAQKNALECLLQDSVVPSTFCHPA
jgi:hypothetical protein